MCFSAALIVASVKSCIPLCIVIVFFSLSMYFDPVLLNYISHCSYFAAQGSVRVLARFARGPGFESWSGHVYSQILHLMAQCGSVLGLRAANWDCLFGFWHSSQKILGPIYLSRGKLSQAYRVAR